MVHTYQLTGMTCSSCEAKVRSALLKLDLVSNVEVSKESSSAKITMDKHIPVASLQKSLDPKYRILALEHSELAEQTRSWFQTYKPILLVFGYILAVTALIQTGADRFDPMQWMRHFMAGFFLVFSFFKILNLKGFTESYVMYDVIAKRVPLWAYVYAFLELTLGIGYLMDFNSMVINWVTLLVMSVSMVGVLQAVLSGKKIQCACLGAVFELPMSTVTIIEDALMIGMSTWMILN